MTLLRVYAPDELRADGYPYAWPEINALVVEQAGYRCVRCGHPYRKGEHGNGEWSSCDERCAHGGPLRWRASDEEDWQERVAGFAEGPVAFYFEYSAMHMRLVNMLPRLCAQRGPNCKGRIEAALKHDALKEFLRVDPTSGLRYSVRVDDYIALCQSHHSLYDVRFNGRKTHCKHGHEFTAANTRINRDGRRTCRACVRRRSAAYQQRRRVL